MHMHRASPCLPPASALLHRSSGSFSQLRQPLQVLSLRLEIQEFCFLQAVGTGWYRAPASLHWLADRRKGTWWAILSSYSWSMRRLLSSIVKAVLRFAQAIQGSFLLPQACL